MTEDDVRSEVLRRFELMVEEVARNAFAVVQNTVVAKKLVSDVSILVREAVIYAVDVADLVRVVSTLVGQVASSVQLAFFSVGTVLIKVIEVLKSVVVVEFLKSAAVISVGAAKTLETNVLALL